MEMQPDPVNSLESIRSKLSAMQLTGNEESSSSDDITINKIEAVVTQFSVDMAKMNTNFQTLVGSLQDVIVRLEQVDHLEKRVKELEEKFESLEKMSSSDFYGRSMTSLTKRVEA